jgi:DNA mismatch endonuclease (patch repair protein)
MTDVHTPEQRRRNMRAIKAKDTSPELAVRRLIHSLGYRYRLHDTALPGKPDLVFAGRRKVVFVHGCFWHQHECRLGSVVAKTNAEFWRDKRAGNQARDTRVKARLEELGWSVCVVWECELRDSTLPTRIQRFLDTEGGIQWPR